MVRLDLNLENKVLGDRYYLHQLVAQSNYSKIFLATDLMVGQRKCAIKQLSPSYCPIEIQSQIESAFLSEVKVLKRLALKHPQICQFYSYFIDSGNQYIVQEWIEGTTLEEKLRLKRRLLETEVKQIVLNILSILECIHSLNVVHNDIKPGNIILRLQDRLPMLIDFGVARQINTNYGQNVVGTPGYMSLEQAMGKTCFNNDLYSLGLTAIYLLTGKSPKLIDFNSDSDNFWHREKNAFDSQLVATIDRAISASSQERFISASEMRETLQFTKTISVLTSNSDRRGAAEPVLAIILGLLGMWFYLSYLTQINSKPPAVVTDSVETEYLLPSQTNSEILADILPATNNATNNNSNSDLQHALQEVIFVPGTTQNKILTSLGEPLWRKPGFWENSIAWSYEDIVSEGFDIGYIFDRQTNILRQAEIAVPPTTQLSTIQSAMNSFLAAESSTIDIERGLQAVYQRQKNTHSFAVGKLEGIIQRNHKDRIYLAVWEADFH